MDAQYGYSENKAAKTKLTIQRVLVYTFMIVLTIMFD